MSQAFNKRKGRKWEATDLSQEIHPTVKPVPSVIRLWSVVLEQGQNVVSQSGWVSVASRGSNKIEKGKKRNRKGMTTN
jgi:hypothetical protein